MVSSTKGYIGEMGRLQVRHLPRSKSQLKTGTLSYQFMGVWHRGHREAGATMEKSSGIRKMQTFRKLPITMPKKKMKAMTKVASLRASVCNVPHPLPTLNAPARSQCPMPNTCGSSSWFSLRADNGKLLSVTSI